MDSEPIVKSGYWWFPNEEERQVGDLRVESGKWPRLILTRQSSNLGEELANRYLKGREVQPLIHGETTTGLVTVCNAIMDGGRVSSSGGPATTEFKGEYALDHMLLPSLDGRHIRKAEASYSTLPDWVGQNGFSVRTLQRFGNFDLRYRKVPKRRYKVAEGLWVTLAFHHPHPPEDLLRNHHIVESPYIVFTTRKPQPVAFYRKQIETLRDFLSFACLEVCSHESVFLHGNFDWRTDQAGKRSYPVGRLHDGQVRSDETPVPRSLTRPDLLFSESDTEDLGDILRGWFRRAGEIEAVRLLYRAAIGPEQYSETRFLFLCQAIESYHRSRSEGVYMRQDKFDAEVLPVLEGAIPSNLSSDHKAALKDRLKYGNEHSLRKRVGELYRECASESLDEVFGANFYSRVVDGRNILVHKGASSEFQEEHLPHLRRYISFLRVIIELCVARDCGFSRAQISAMAKKRCQQIKLGKKR